MAPHSLFIQGVNQKLKFHILQAFFELCVLILKLLEHDDTLHHLNRLGHFHWIICWPNLFYPSWPLDRFAIFCGFASRDICLGSRVQWFDTSRCLKWSRLIRQIWWSRTIRTALKLTMVSLMIVSLCSQLDSLTAVIQLLFYMWTLSLQLRLLTR